MANRPCDCVELSKTGFWVCACGCSNSGDYGYAMSWCSEANAEGCFQSLYDSEINFSVSCCWDGGFDVKLGDAMNGWLAQEVIYKWEAVSPWLITQAIKHFPNSTFSKAFGVDPA